MRAGKADRMDIRRQEGALVAREQFRLLSGDDLIRTYGGDVGAAKAFCSVCGSSLFGGKWPGGRLISIRMGAFDDDPGIEPQFHTYVGSCASWDRITDTLPQFEAAWSANEQPSAPT
jgi:hypothetical protein